MTKRVLIIDDEENIRRVIRLALETAGYEVGEARDGERGLEAYKDGSTWDAVLLDQKMPGGLDGLETLQRIKERRPAARVIMVTAFASIELAVDAMKFGATDFVRKPMTPEIVRNAVQAAIAKVEPVFSSRDVQPEEAPSRPLVDTVTMNGFHISRPAEMGDEIPNEKNERRFIVTSPGGGDFKVTVKIENESVAYVERMTRRRLPPENSFWTQRAERTLAEYLWTEGRTPPNGKLTVGQVDRDQLAIAERWSGN